MHLGSAAVVRRHDPGGQRLIYAAGLYPRPRLNSHGREGRLPKARFAGERVWFGVQAVLAELGDQRVKTLLRRQNIVARIVEVFGRQALAMSIAADLLGRRPQLGRQAFQAV